MPYADPEVARQYRREWQRRWRRARGVSEQRRSDSFHAIHKWLRRHFPKAGVCEECGAEGPTDYAFKKHPEPHTRDRDDYRELCRHCHMVFDQPHTRSAEIMRAAKVVAA